MAKTCNPCTLLDPLVVPAVFDPTLSPAQQLAWCVREIQELNRRVADLEGRTAAQNVDD